MLVNSFSGKTDHFTQLGGGWFSKVDLIVWIRRTVSNNSLKRFLIFILSGSFDRRKMKIRNPFYLLKKTLFQEKILDLHRN